MHKMLARSRLVGKKTLPELRHGLSCNGGLRGSLHVIWPHVVRPFGWGGGPTMSNSNYCGPLGLVGISHAVWVPASRGIQSNTIWNLWVSSAAEVDWPHFSNFPTRCGLWPGGALPRRWGSLLGYAIQLQVGICGSPPRRRVTGHTHQVIGCSG